VEVALYGLRRLRKRPFSTSPPLCQPLFHLLALTVTSLGKCEETVTKPVRLKIPVYNFERGLYEIDGPEVWLCAEHSTWVAKDLPNA